MKKTIIVTLLSFLFIASVQAYDVKVRGHSNSNGTYTQEHYRTSPNNTQSDNWGTKGNSNPYTQVNQDQKMTTLMTLGEV